MKTLLIALMLTLLCSCAPMTADRLLGPGYPEAYGTGYVHGYASGKAQAGLVTGGFTKDVYRFQSDELYRQGWTDGAERGRQFMAEIRRF